MRERIKKLIALIMTALMLSQLPGFDALIVLAAESTVNEDTTITTDMTDAAETTYVFGTGLSSFTVESGASVGGIKISNDGTYTIYNSGSIGSADISGGAWVYVPSDGQIDTIVSTGTGRLYLNGPVQVTNFTAPASTVYGSGGVVVNGSLNLTGSGSLSSDAVINVTKDTAITTTNAINVYMDGSSYAIPAGSSGTTVVDQHGKAVSCELPSSVAVTQGELSEKYMPGEMFVIVLAPVDGYYFPEDYSVTTSDDVSSFACTWDSYSSVTFGCYVVDTDPETINITVPDAKELELGTGTLTVPDVYVGETWETTIDSDTHSDVIEGAQVYYKPAVADDTAYSTEAPTAAGSYEAKVTLPATGVYKELMLTDSFSILKKDADGAFIVPDIVYGETITPEITSTTHASTDILVEYKDASATDDEYSPDQPTEVGSYIARVTFLETTTYKKLELTDEFAINKAAGTATITVADVVYGEIVSPGVASTTNTGVTPTVQYKGADETEYTETVPTAVGSYEAKVTYPATASYTEATAVAEFEITKATGSATITVEDVTYGEEIVAKLSSVTHDIGTAIVEYMIAGADESTYTTSLPTAVGNYVARVIFSANENYNELVTTTEFEITKAEGTATITVADVVYGEIVSPEVASTTNTGVTPTVQYKGVDETEYTETVPTAVGSYEAKVTYPATASYTEATAIAEFEITKAEGTATFIVEDITEGEMVSPQISSTVYDVDSATVEYKVSGADDTTYATDIPTEAGSYIARVIFAANDFYNQLTMTDEFVIESAPKEEIPEEETTETPEEDATEEPTTEAPETDNTEDEEIVELQPGTGSFVVPDAYYGTSVNPQITSATNTVAGVSVEYKVLGASDATYTTKAPTAVGKYVARVTLPSSDDYKEVVLTDEFAIDYLPVPANAYTLVGNTGDNGYYTSEVNVVARDGYVLSTFLNGEYVEQLTISSSQAATVVYFMDKSTGAKTNGVSISAIDIDLDAPEVDAEGDNTYYGDSLAVAISDDNLASVTLNGDNVELDRNRIILELKSNGGIEEYTIVVTDTAGHTRNITIKVAAEWTKTGEIPSGAEVKLQAGTTYTLGTGTWTVNGDTTSYNGNSTFYVRGDGSYTFNQQ